MHGLKAVIGRGLTLVVVGVVIGLLCVVHLVERVRARWLSTVRASRFSALRSRWIAARVPRVRSDDAGLAVAAADRAGVQDVAGETDLAEFAEYGGQSLRDPRR